jgi:molybdenum cofactor biosynthesis enzyme MoaA
VLFNTNGTVLNERNGRALIEAELDELRVSFDAANAESYRAIRGKNYFNRILKNVRAFCDLQERAENLNRSGLTHRVLCHTQDRVLVRKCQS